VKKKRKTWIAVLVFVLLTVAVPFWSFSNIEDNLNDEASMLDSYKALESTEMEWNGRNCYLIVPGNMSENLAEKVAEDIEGIQGVRNAEIIYDGIILLKEDEIVITEKSPGGFTLEWNTDGKNISGNLDEDSGQKVDDIFDVDGLSIDDEYSISDNILDKLKAIGAQIFDELSKGKLEVDGESIRLSGTVADADEYDNIIDRLNDIDGLELDLKRPEPDDTGAVEYVIEFDNIQFEFAEIRVADASMETLDEIAKDLLENDDVYVDIVGHTDTVGTMSTNQYLSQKRAEEVARQLEIRGVEPSRMNSYGMGETMPIDANDTDEAHATNRRVEILLGGNN